MAKDSVFNAASVVRLLTGKEISDYDLHVNVVGGGKIDGPSAGLAVALALISAIENIPMRQDVAVTGEVSLQGKVKPVGGIQEKIYGAKQAQVKRVLVPLENEREVPKGLTDIEVIPVSCVQDALALVSTSKEALASVNLETNPSLWSPKHGAHRLTS